MRRPQFDRRTCAYAGAGKWQRVEAGTVLNDPGRTNSRLDLWMDGVKDARLDTVKWLCAYRHPTQHSLLENCWNGDAPS